MHSQAHLRWCPAGPTGLKPGEHAPAERLREGADVDVLAASRQLSPTPTPRFTDMRRQSVRVLTPATVVREMSPPSYARAEVDGEAMVRDRIVAAKRVYRQPSPLTSQTILHAASPHNILKPTISAACLSPNEIVEEVASPKPSQAALRGSTNRSPHVVTRQCTPLSYRVKDHIAEDSDENREEDSPATARRASRRTSPVALSRSLDRERHGGEHAAPEPQDVVTVACALPEEPPPSCKAAAPPVALPRSWSLERDRSGPADAMGATMLQELRATSPALPVGGRQARAARPVSRLASRSPTPNGTPIMLSRDADRERHGQVPVTIWRGLDRERLLEVQVTPDMPSRASLGSPKPGAAAPGPAAAPRLSTATVLSSPQLREQDSAEPPPSLASPCSAERVRHRNLAEALVQAATKGKGGGPREPPQAAGVDASARALGACAEAGPPASLTMRKSLTPTRSRPAGFPAAAPLSSRSTLPANFRPAALLAAAQAQAAARPQAPTAAPAAAPAQASAAARVFSPGLSPRAASGPRSVPPPGLPFGAGPPCYPGAAQAALPLKVGACAASQTVLIPMSCKLRVNPGPAVPRPGHHPAH